MGKRILYVETVEIGLLDIPRTLDELGYSVFKASLAVRAQTYDDAAKERLLVAIRDVEADYVITYDFVESVAEACYLSDVPYIAWVYDAPQKELYTRYAQYDSNYIFVFDSSQRQRLSDIGIKNVFYIPLAIHAKKVELALKRGKENQKEQETSCDISFVGQLYKIDSNEEILSATPDYIRNSLENSMEKSFLKWDGPSFHGNMESEAISYLSSIDSNNVLETYPYISLQFFYEAAVTGRILANRERVYILNNLSKDFDVNFYTFDKDISQLSSDVKVHPGVKYDYEVSNIYSNSKINLNISLHCIETGASQRILDCMAAGGFMLSNYQSDLVEMFVPGEEIAIYHTYEELVQQISYYLEHEDERCAIAKRGQKKVLKKYNFAVALTQVMDKVSKIERNKEQTYINKDCQKLEEITQKAFIASDPEKKKNELSKLREVYSNPKYKTLMTKYDKFGILYEMLNIWNIEKDYGIENLFEKMFDVNEAERLYHRIKFLLWRMESGASYENSLEAVRSLYEEEVSNLLIVWIVYANLRDVEDVIIQYGKLLNEIDHSKALELLSYGSFYCPESKTILFNKVDILLELGLYEEALKELQGFKNRDDETNAIIAELETALGK